MKEQLLFKFERDKDLRTNLFQIIELAKRMDSENLPGQKRLRSIKEWVLKD